MRIHEDQNHEQLTPTYDAEALTKGGTVAFIRLYEQTYTLRITKGRKLILTK